MPWLVSEDLCSRRFKSSRCPRVATASVIRWRAVRRVRCRFRAASQARRYRKLSPQYAATLPSPTYRSGHHRAALPAAERLAELGHVAHDAVDAKLARRVFVGLDHETEPF